MDALTLTGVPIFLLGLPLLAASLIVLGEACAAAFLRAPVRRVAVGGPRIAVIVPAHDEEAIIAQTIGHIRAELPPEGRILVVADNCRDATARLAVAAGADVVERFDATRRGKGYALDFGVRYLSPNAPDVVVIIDADCRPLPGSIAKIASLAQDKHRPVQGAYLLEAPTAAASPYMKMAVLAWRLKNIARPLGLMKLGLPSQLYGTGMAIPFDLLQRVELASGNLVEDTALGLDCAALGKAPLFCDEAAFVSQFPSDGQAQSTQRSRWEAGHLATVRKVVPGLLSRAIAQRNRDLFVMACDIAVPPLALLVLCALACAGIGLLGMAIGGGYLPLTIPLLSIAAVGAAVIIAGDLIFKDTISISDLLLAPAYVASKIVLYVRIMIGQKVEWIRTRRD